jgi:hypothetical protein
MEPALVHCSGCRRDWHSPTLAAGLREVGSCPRCGGTLVFFAPPAAPAPGPRRGTDDGALAPHLVLGVPRR